MGADGVELYLDESKSIEGLRHIRLMALLRELEIELIEDRKLTLPPSTYPWDSFDRRNQLWRRKQALERAKA